MFLTVSDAARLPRRPHPRLLLQGERVRGRLQRRLHPHAPSTPTFRLRQAPHRVLLRALQERRQARLAREAVVGFRPVGLQGLLGGSDCRVFVEPRAWRGRDDRGDGERDGHHSSGPHVYVRWNAGEVCQKAAQRQFSTYRCQAMHLLKSARNQHVICLTDTVKEAHERSMKKRRRRINPEGLKDWKPPMFSRDQLRFGW